MNMPTEDKATDQPTHIIVWANSSAISSRSGSSADSTKNRGENRGETGGVNGIELDQTG